MFRDWRTLRGLSKAELARQLNCHDSLLSRFESGARKPSRKFAEQLDALLKADQALVRAWDDVDWDREVVHPDWFQLYADLEAKAELIQSYDVKRIRGLLQTPDYARALFRFAKPKATNEQLANSVAARMSRRRRFFNPEGPQLVTVLDESTIWRTVGGPAVMRGQLQHLLDVGQDFPNIVIQIAQFGLGERTGPTGSMTLLTLPGGERWAYSESMSKGYFATDEGTLKERSRFYDRLRAEALSAPESARLIRRAMRGLVNVPISYPSKPSAYSFQKAAWQTSSYSEGDGGECVEVALNLDATVPVRDSKDRQGPQLQFPATAWSAFVQSVTTGEFDRA
jgi:transcriptional regulator with XRE-family HTH domain